MLVSIIIACVLGVQPICDRTQFEKSCGKVLTGEYKSVANAIFDAYLDQVGAIEDSNTLDAEKTASSYLFDLIQSLTLLDDNGRWEEASNALRRSVLLQSRQVTNPWPATVWVDLALLDDVNVTSETNSAVNEFLQKYYIVDLEERYAALGAIVSGNTLLCEQLTANAMKRWAAYQQVIEPYMSHATVQFAAYPNLNTGHMVREVMDDLEKTNLDPLEERFIRWSTWHNTQTQATIALIRSARSTYLFDPWSTRCGASTNKRALKLQQQLLQLSATVRDKNNVAISSLRSIAQKSQ